MNVLLILGGAATLYGLVLSRRQIAQTTPTNPAAAIARKQFAQLTGVAETDVQIVAVEPETWPDASLGISEPGYLYTQVLTPGFRVELRTAGGRAAEYHCDTRGTCKLCPPCTAKMNGSRSSASVIAVPGLSGPGWAR